MSRSHKHHSNAEEAAAELNASSEYQQELVRHLMKYGTGKNAQCFPILAYGGNNADLLSTGCTGIIEIRVLHDKVQVKIGGHKTVRDSDEDFSFDNLFTVPFVHDSTLTPNMKATALKIHEESLSRIKTEQQKWRTQ